MIERTEKTSSTQPAGDIDAAPLQTDGDSAPLLPEPSFVSGDPATVLAKLFVKSSQQKRQSDEITADIEAAAEDAADAKRVEAMKDKAEKTMMAGMVGGFSQVAAGGCGIFAGVTKSTIWEGAGTATAGGGKIFEAGLKSEADSADRDIARAESDGKLAKRAQDQLRRQVDAASQHEGKVMQLLQEIKQAQAQCERAALLRMA